MTNKSQKNKKIKKDENIKKNPKKVKNKIKKNPEKKKEKEQNILFWSSLVLSTNMWTAYLTGQYLYSILFASLTISSLIVHSHPHIISNLYDKLWISCIVLYGGYKMWNKRKICNRWMLLFCVLTFLFCVWVYVYGFITSQYCFCDDVKKGNLWHAFMHIIVSLGHHSIIFL
jgi:hypothetical protein